MLIALPLFHMTWDNMTTTFLIVSYGIPTNAHVFRFYVSDFFNLDVIFEIIRPVCIISRIQQTIQLHHRSQEKMFFGIQIFCLLSLHYKNINDEY